MTGELVAGLIVTVRLLIIGVAAYAITRLVKGGRRQRRILARFLADRLLTCERRTRRRRWPRNPLAARSIAPPKPP